MQIKSPLFLMILSISQISCTNNQLPEEKFAAPKGSYPPLVDVPDRPSPLSEKEIEMTRKQLESGYHSARELLRSHPVEADSPK